MEAFGPQIDLTFKKWEGKPLLDQEALEPAAVLKLRQDYLQQLHSKRPKKRDVVLDEIWVEAYYGTYSGCDIVYMGTPIEYSVAQRSVIVVGYIIVLDSGKELYIHKDSHFYTLKEACDAGYITTEDVETFGPKVNSTFRKWEG